MHKILRPCLHTPQRFSKAKLPTYKRTVGSTYRTMGSDNGGYTVTVSVPAALGAVPDKANEKSHWVKNEAGEVKRFRNPWESSHDFSFPEIFKAMVQ